VSSSQQLPPTERAHPAVTDLAALSTPDLLAAMSAEDVLVPEIVREQLPAIARAVEGVERRLRAGGRLVYVGAGTSGRIALMEAAEARPTFGVPPDMVVGMIAGGLPALTASQEGAEDDTVAAEREIDELDIGPGDAVVGISASGRTPYVIAAVRQARRRGALAIGLSCDDGAPLVDEVEIAICPVVGPELVAGSTRLKAGTAQKLVVNMLTTAVMVRLGRIHGQLMVDLQAVNEKLRRRAQRIVEEVSGRPGPDAEAALVEAGWSPKLAIVMLDRGVGPDDARRLLATGQSLPELLADHDRTDD
jgi:N-acetylmuramic acid 6-phosphate etherase